MIISVFLIEDRPFVREGLAPELDSHADIELIGCSVHGPEAVRQVRQLHAPVVIMGFRIHDASSIGAIAEMAEVCPRARIIVLSGTFRLEHAIQAFGAGARGYVSLGSSAELVSASARK